MKNYISIISALIFLGFLTSCSRSAVYSPSVNLPNTPLKKSEVDLQGGIELFPESRPDNIDSKTTLGLNGQITYGFSDKFSLAAKSWADIEGRGNFFRSGYSLTGQFIVPRSESSRIIIMPRVGFAAQDTDISGYGLATSILYQKTISSSISYYAGVGLAWGFEELTKRENTFDEEKVPMGYGAIGNIGLSWKILEKLRLNLELNPIYQINTFDEDNNFILSPQLGLGYTFRRKTTSHLQRPSNTL